MDLLAGAFTIFKGVKSKNVTIVFKKPFFGLQGENQDHLVRTIPPFEPVISGNGAGHTANWLRESVQCEQYFRFNRTVYLGVCS